MGCGNTREDIEDKIMVIRLKRTNIQLEREKNLKILSELEGYPINMDNLADYLASSKKGKPINLNSEKQDINDINKQNQSPDNEIKSQNEKLPTLINNPIGENENIDNEKEMNNELSNKLKIELNNNIVDNNNMVDNNNDMDNNNIHILNLDSPTKRVPKKKKKTKRKKKEVLNENNINNDINDINDINNNNVININNNVGDN